MTVFGWVAATLIDHDGPIAITERIDRGRTDAARCYAAGDDRRVDLVLGQKRDDRCLEEHRRSTLQEREVVRLIEQRRVNLESGTANPEFMVQCLDFPELDVLGDCQPTQQLATGMPAARAAWTRGTVLSRAA